MLADIPAAGAAPDPLGRQAHQEWLDAARQAGLDLTGFDPDAPFAARVAWVTRLGWAVATAYAGTAPGPALERRPGPGRNPVRRPEKDVRPAG